MQKHSKTSVMTQICQCVHDSKTPKFASRHSKMELQTTKLGEICAFYLEIECFCTDFAMMYVSCCSETAYAIGGFVQKHSISSVFTQNYGDFVVWSLFYKCHDTLFACLCLCAHRHFCASELVFECFCIHEGPICSRELFFSVKMSLW